MILYCLDMSSLSHRSSVIICPRYLYLLSLGNVSPFSKQFELFTRKYDNVAVGTITYSEHTANNIDKPIDEGAMSTISSAYIKWLINEEPIIHPAFTLFNCLILVFSATSLKGLVNCSNKLIDGRKCGDCHSWVNVTSSDRRCSI